MNIILASKWFAWPPHFIHDAIKGLEALAEVIAFLIEWLSREWM